MRVVCRRISGCAFHSGAPGSPPLLVFGFRGPRPDDKVRRAPFGPDRLYRRRRCSIWRPLAEKLPDHPSKETVSWHRPQLLHFHAVSDAGRWWAGSRCSCHARLRRTTNVAVTPLIANCGSIVRLGLTAIEGGLDVEFDATKCARRGFPDARHPLDCTCCISAGCSFGNSSFPEPDNRVFAADRSCFMDDRCSERRVPNVHWDSALTG
jgi:hypothetical protein